MGKVSKVVDSILFVFFLIFVIGVPIVDPQIVIQGHFFPNWAIKLKIWYIDTFGDYLYKERPSFFIGLLWVEILLQWPLAFFNLFAIIFGPKLWFPATCLIFGISSFTSMTAMVAELIGSGRAPNAMFMLYVSFTGSAVLAILRGLLTHKTTTVSRHKVETKKRA